MFKVIKLDRHAPRDAFRAVAQMGPDKGYAEQWAGYLNDNLKPVKSLAWVKAPPEEAYAGYAGCDGTLYESGWCIVQEAVNEWGEIGP